MARSAEGDPREAGPRAGALSALLQDLARAPDVTEGAAWVAVLRPGARIGKLELVRELGRGGFGVVWEARDLELGRPVAFKAVRSGGQPGVRGERLLREAEAAARLQHPNIVTLHDVGRAEPGPYLVLELLRGRTLAGRLAEGPLPPAEAVRIAGEVSKGVAHAHAQGVVHRDLKPENVFLCDDRQVKVLDFGLAHAFGQPRADGGTPGYMAPEQLAGAPEDERTDVFALGVMLHEMLSGKRPFEDERALRSRSAAPALEVPGEPELGELAGRLLAKDPLARPRNAGEVRDALLALQRPASARPTSGPVRVRRRPLLRLAAFVAAGVAIGVLAALAALWRPGAPAPPAGADGRVVVAVADFANETSDPDLDGLSGLLITSLAQSPRLQVLTRSRLFDLVRQVGREPVERIDEPLARELGRRAGAKVLLLASIRRFDDVYSVELRGLDPVADAYLFTAREQVPGKRGIPGLVDALAVRTRVALREPEAEVRRSGLRVAEAVTGNLEAYRHYFLGLQRIDEYRFEEGRAELVEAIRLDPDFAQPHLQLVMGQLWSWVPPREREAHLAAALSRAERLPETDRLILLAEEALLRGRLDEAYRGYQRAQESSPSDKRILLRMYWLSRGLRGDLEGAASLAERALSLDPSWQPAQDALAIALVFRGEFGRAEALAREWAERWPSPLSLAVLNGVLLHAARPQEALAVARKAEAIGDPGGLGVHVLARTLVQLDRFEEAEAALRRRAAVSPGNALVDRLQPEVALYRGQRRAMQRMLDGDQGPGDAPSAISVFLAAGDADVAGALALARRALPEVPGASAAAAFAVAGHAEAAAELLERHVAGTPASGTVLPRAVGTIVEALRARDRGDVEGARRILDGLRRGPSRPTSHAASFVLGRICFEARDDACAVEAFDQFQRHHWLFDVSAWAYPRSLLLRASSEERMGRREEARATVERLLAIWKHADADLPLLAEARALQARLAAAPFPATPPAAPTPSIAVLPFVDMSPGKDQEYLSEGIAEEILNALARVEGLRVVGRTSSWYFKGRSARLADVGRELRVASVLEGSVRREGSRLRVSAKLLAVPDGRSLWTETYDRDLGDVFALQDDVASHVAVALRARLLPARGAGAEPQRTTPEAYLQYLLGYQHWARGAAGDIPRSVEAFERALQLDPAYAPAWAGLAWSLESMAEDQESLENRLAMKRRAFAAAERAVERGPDEPRAYYARGGLRAYHRHEWREGLADLERAIRLRPNDAPLHRVHGWILGPLGRHPEAIAALGRATDLEPLAIRGWNILAGLHVDGGNLEEARKASRKALSIAPGHPTALAQAALILLLEGRPADALRASREPGLSQESTLQIEALAEHSLGHAAESRRALDQLVTRYSTSAAYDIACVHAWRGEADEAFAWLDRADAQVDWGMVWVRDEAFLRPLHGDPRWKPLLRKLNLPVD